MILRRGAVAAAVIAIAGCSAAPAGVTSAPSDGPAAKPPAPLRSGGPREAGLRPADARKIPEVVRDGLGDYYPGAVVLAGRNGVIAVHEAMGDAVRYHRPGDRLAHPVPARKDTIYDIASLTKLFTTVAAMRMAERGKIELDRPVVSYLPEFAPASAPESKRDITIRHLLTHTSGLPDTRPLHEHRDPVKALYSAKPVTRPGKRYVYSDLGLITLGRLMEKVDGRRLDLIVQQDVVKPLGLRDTGFRPPKAKRSRIAATGWAGRRLLRGTVHDPNARALGGIAGHAGIFSTARDLAVFAHALLGRNTLMSERSRREMFTEQNEGMSAEASRGLGWWLDQPKFMGRMASPHAAGHTGFTGASIVLDLRTRAFVILLTNRVHAPGEGRPPYPARAGVGSALARAVRPG